MVFFRPATGQGHHDVPGVSLFLIPASILLLASTAGCIIPIPFAVYPAEEVGSRLEVAFFDELDRPIDADGLLIVHRTNHSGGPAGTIVLEVRQGGATLPEKWTMNSLWVMGHLYTYFLLPTIIDTSFENLYLVHLIPGYDYPPDALGHRTLGPEGEVEPPGKIRVLKSSDGRFQLHHSADNAARAALYWEKGVLPYLGTMEHPPDKAYWPDMILSDADCERVRSLIERELAAQRETASDKAHTFVWPPPRQRPTSRVGDYIVE